jgi:hypothetical protein
VPRRGDRQKAFLDFLRFVAIDHPFGVRLRAEFQSMNDARGAKTRGVAFGIGHIVAMREKDVS